MSSKLHSTNKQHVNNLVIASDHTNNVYITNTAITTQNKITLIKTNLDINPP